MLVEADSVPVVVGVSDTDVDGAVLHPVVEVESEDGEDQGEDGKGELGVGE